MLLALLLATSTVDTKSSIMRHKWTSLSESLPPPGMRVWVWRQWIPEGETKIHREIRFGTRNNEPLTINEDWTKDMHWSGCFADVTVHAWRYCDQARIPRPRFPRA